MALQFKDLDAMYAFVKKVADMKVSGTANAQLQALIIEARDILEKLNRS